MILKLRKIGNSQGVVLPQAVLRDLGLEPGTEIGAKVVRGKLVLARSEPHYTLEELLAKVKPEHRQPETDWGADRGAEAIEYGEPY